MSSERVEQDQYDRGITPAETAARKEREGEGYKDIPEPESDLDTTGGYTVDREGLLNNYAVEPEMYYEVPGDRTQIKAAEKATREQELHDINDNDESGLLTEDADKRGKGSGIV
ncbi:hypothetical protein [Leptothermofonsia sp. ETS-13]|uniref:hypothetical protein n=1 Tax=Leptothermofonsia sp. ETS-13 TaxID=3035696 RepID=UPI003B9E7CD6